MSTLKVNELDTKTGTTITVAAGKTLAGSDIIGATQIAANAVTTGKILDDNVTYGKLQDTTTANRVIGAVAAGTIGEVEVATDMVANNAITAAKISGASAAAAGTFLRQDGTFAAIDTASILNDIATLALQQATQNDQSAYNLANAFVDQYEDSTGIDVATDCARSTGEYMATVIGVDQTTTLVNDITRSSAESKFGGYSALFDGTDDYLRITADTAMNITGGDFTIETWIKTATITTRLGILGRRNSGQTSIADGGYFVSLYNGKFALGGNIDGTWYDAGGGNFLGTTDLRDGNWHHVATVREGTTYSQYVDGSREQTQVKSGTLSEPAVNSAIGGTSNGNTVLEGDWNGNIDEFRLSTVARYSGATYTVPTAAFTSDSNTKLLLHMDDVLLTDSSGNASGSSANATGNYTSTTETAASTVSKMGIVVLYKNESGTATLDTDLVAQVSSNGGTNYTSAPLTTAGTFSTGILIAKSNDITISNTGTAPKFKISFANQLSGTKETRVYGVALLY